MIASADGTVADCHVHAEVYEGYVAVTFWGDFSYGDFLKLGNHFYRPWTVVTTIPGGWPSLWLVRRLTSPLGGPDGFRRVDSERASLTYNRQEDTTEIGVIVDDPRDAFEAASTLTHDGLPREVDNVLAPAE